MEQIEVLIIFALLFFIYMFFSWSVFRSAVTSILDKLLSTGLSRISVGLLFFIYATAIFKSKVTNYLVFLFLAFVLFIMVSILWNYIREEGNDEQRPFKLIEKVIALAIIFSPVLLLMLMSQSLSGMGKVGNMHDWIGFWGSFVGSLVAFGGIYWQVNRQSEQQKEQIRNQFNFQRALAIEDARPKMNLTSTKFIEKISKDQLYENKVLAKAKVKEYVHNLIKEKISYSILQIENTSTNVAYDCRLLITINIAEEDDFNPFNWEEHKEEVTVGTLRPGEKVNILPDFLLKIGNKEVMSMVGNIAHISSKNEVGYYNTQTDISEFVMVMGNTEVQAYGKDKMISLDEAKNKLPNMYAYFD